MVAAFTIRDEEIIIALESSVFYLDNKAIITNMNKRINYFYQLYSLTFTSNSLFDTILV